MTFKLLLKYLYLSVLTLLTAACLTTQYQLQQLLRAPVEFTLSDNHTLPSVRVYLPDIPNSRRPLQSGNDQALSVLIICLNRAMLYVEV